MKAKKPSVPSETEVQWQKSVRYNSDINLHSLSNFRRFFVRKRNGSPAIYVFELWRKAEHFFVTNCAFFMKKKEGRRYFEKDVRYPTPILKEMVTNEDGLLRALFLN